MRARQQDLCGLACKDAQWCEVARGIARKDCAECIAKAKSRIMHACDPRLSPAGHTSRAEKDDGDEPQANTANATDYSRPSADTLHGQNKQRDANQGDDNI